jgi:hypothetical protein
MTRADGFERARPNTGRMSLPSASLFVASLWIVPSPPLAQDPAAAEAAQASAAEREADFAKLERAIPQDATVYAAVRDLDALREDLQKNAWYGFFRDPEVRAWIDWGLRKSGGLDFADAPLDPFALASAVHGSAVFFEVWNVGDKYPSCGGALVQPGKERDAFDAQLDRALEHLRADATSSMETHGTTELEILELHQEHAEPGSSPTFALFDLPDMVGFVGSSKREVVLSTAHAVLDRYLGEDSSEGIAGQALLAEARRSAVRRGRLEVWLDTAPVIAAGLKRDPPEKGTQLALDLTGVLGVQWIYLCADAGPGESFDLTLAADVPESGLLKSMYDALGAFPAEWTRLCPKGSTSIGLASFDLWALWQAGWKRFAELAPELHKAVRTQLEGTVQTLGLDVEGQLLSQLDGRCASFNVEVPLEEWTTNDGRDHATLGLTAPEGPKLGTAYLIGIRDRAAVEAFVDKLLEVVGMQGGVGPEDVETVEFQGHEVQELELPLDAKLSWSFDDRALVVSMYPSALRAALRLRGKSDEPTAASNPRFASVLASFAGAPIVAINDTRAALELLLSSVRGALEAMEQIAGSETPAESKAGPRPPLPGLDLVERFFKGTLSTAVTKRAGSAQLVISAR